MNSFALIKYGTGLLCFRIKTRVSTESPDWMHESIQKLSIIYAQVYVPLCWSIWTAKKLNLTHTDTSMQRENHMESLVLWLQAMKSATCWENLKPPLQSTKLIDRWVQIILQKCCIFNWFAATKIHTKDVDCRVGLVWINETNHSKGQFAFRKEPEKEAFGWSYIRKFFLTLRTDYSINGLLLVHEPSHITDSAWQPTMPK